jgi:hypothetical protein
MHVQVCVRVRLFMCVIKINLYFYFSHSRHVQVSTIDLDTKTSFTGHVCTVKMDYIKFSAGHVRVRTIDVMILFYWSRA